MGHLPTARVTQLRPFETIRVDYCGWSKKDSSRTERPSRQCLCVSRWRRFIRRGSATWPSMDLSPPCEDSSHEEESSTRSHRTKNQLRELYALLNSRTHNTQRWSDDILKTVGTAKITKSPHLARLGTTSLSKMSVLRINVCDWYNSFIKQFFKSYKYSRYIRILFYVSSNP